MAYNDSFSNIIQGLGQFSQGYMQGQRLREEDAMRRAQFEQQQKMAGLQYQQAEQRMSQVARDRQIAEQSTALARATMTGDWDTASRMHYDLTDGAIAAVREHDADNVKVIRGDNTFSVVPKREYAEIAAAGNDPRLMVGAISRIMTAEARADLAAQNAMARREIEEQKAKVRTEETDKKLAARKEEWQARFKTQYELARMRAARASSSGGGKGATGGLSAFERKFNLYKSELMKNQGMTEQDASNEALRLSTPGAETERTLRGDKIRLLKTIVENGGAGSKEAEAELAELNRELSSKRKTGPASSTATAKPAAGGGPDFSGMGFKQDKKTGNWQNPNTGVYFRNNNGKIEAWSNKRNAWVPTGK